VLFLMKDAKKLRRTAIAAGAAILVIAAIWRVGGDALAQAGSRLSPANDPAILKLATLAAAARGDAATIRVIAGLAATSVQASDRDAAKSVGSAALGFTDQLEPAARSVGMTIAGPAPAPEWLIPCFRDAQTTVQAAGTILVQWGTQPADSETSASADAAVRDLSDLANLVDIVASTGGPRSSPPPAATDASHIGGKLADPQAACQMIQTLSRQLAATRS
jgi:hypothetical protein